MRYKKLIIPLFLLLCIDILSIIILTLWPYRFTEFIDQYITPSLLQWFPNGSTEGLISIFILSSLIYIIIFISLFVYLYLSDAIKTLTGLTKRDK